MHSFKNVLLQKAKDGTVLLKMASWLLNQELKKTTAEKRARKNKSSFWTRRTAVV